MLVMHKSHEKMFFKRKNFTFGELWRALFTFDKESDCQS